MSLLLSAEDESIYRDAAADAWKKAGGTFVIARRLMKRDPRIVGLDAMTILFLLKAAWEIWKWWKERNVSDPGVTRLMGEPYFGSQE
tara:strand:- start:5630 stop:5890 length:261 start_codon:yes stop_codon:yes gene_type:complete